MLVDFSYEDAQDKTSGHLTFEVDEIDNVALAYMFERFAKSIGLPVDEVILRNSTREFTSKDYGSY